ncbi:hypothetical protein HMPREF9372_0030 [Sporosarcina newyorkensis 2681]|uniref:Uncharacterized protein n=1 Tax=Sporosarcina newyorkensis 2681 TaxID=1027292 RepID=F9DMK0_9BACL|nr:hypothetical protein HMPREF9372_0030 [Sporosarcina newyorkensis 2681]
MKEHDLWEISLRHTFYLSLVNNEIEMYNKGKDNSMKVVFV